VAAEDEEDTAVVVDTGAAAGDEEATIGALEEGGILVIDRIPDPDLGRGQGAGATLGTVLPPERGTTTAGDPETVPPPVADPAARGRPAAGADPGAAADRHTRDQTHTTRGGQIKFCVRHTPFHG